MNEINGGFHIWKLLTSILPFFRFQVLMTELLIHNPQICENWRICPQSSLMTLFFRMNNFLTPWSCLIFVVEIEFLILQNPKIGNFKHKGLSWLFCIIDVQTLIGQFWCIFMLNDEFLGLKEALYSNVLKKNIFY